MTYPANLLTEDEIILKDFHPHWRVLLSVVGYAALLIAGSGVAYWQAEGTVPMAVTGVLGLGFIGLSLPPLVSWRFTQYVLTTERIIVRTGILTKTGHEIPLESIDNATFHQRLLERMLGYGDLIVESTQGQTSFADIPKPEQFQQDIYKAREERTLALRGQGSGPRDAVSKLESLANLRDRGVITDEEFEAKKANLLDEM